MSIVPYFVNLPTTALDHDRGERTPTTPRSALARTAPRAEATKGTFTVGVRSAELSASRPTSPNKVVTWASGGRHPGSYSLDATRTEPDRTTLSLTFADKIKSIIILIIITTITTIKTESNDHEKTVRTSVARTVGPIETAGSPLWRGNPFRFAVRHDGRVQ